MEIEFVGELWFWKGPAPWYFITVPEAEAECLKDESRRVSYGWGMIPVIARIGSTQWATSLFPKDDRYIVPIKAAVRTTEGLVEGDTPLVHLSLRT